MSVLASLVTCLAEVSTGWALTTSELDFLSCLKVELFPRYGYGAENILSMRVVLADGRVAEVTAEKTEVSESFFFQFSPKNISPDSLSNTKHGDPHRQQQPLLCSERSRLQLWSSHTVQV